MYCSRCGSALASKTAHEEALPESATEELEAKLREALSPNLLVIRRLGQGGMAVVFLARQPSLKRLVAVKVLSPLLAADPRGRGRFQREAEAAAGISHPNVVSIYGVGALSDGTPYFVMQYVAGESLAERLEREGSLEVDEARRVLGQVAGALAAAHARGIIHRDIKPANVLYDQEAGRVLVSDFGIAAVRPSAEAAAPSTRLTATGMAVGTPQYMSPEQLLAEPVTERTDIYSLGLLGYELLTGRGPFEISSPREILAAHLRDAPKKLSALRSEVDPELESVLEACLEKDPERRPTAAELARRWMPGGGVLLEWPPPGLERLRESLRSATRWLGLGTLLLVFSALEMINLGPKLSSGFTSLGPAALLASGVAGAVLVVMGGWVLWRLGRGAARLAHEGVGWLTLAEVVADPRGDTGALISGTREYAPLPPQVRSSLRVTRVWAAAAFLLAALIPIPFLATAVWLGFRGLWGPAGALWLTLAPPLALVALGWGLRLQEQRKVAAIRKRLQTRHQPNEKIPRLVEAWYQSFEGARHDQRLGRGLTGRSLPGWVAALALAVALVLPTLVILPLSVVGALGPGLWGNNLPVFSSTQDKARIAAAVRPYRLRPDPSITPLEGGRAYYTLALGGQPPTGSFPQNPVPRPLPLPWFDFQASPAGVHLLQGALGIDTLLHMALRGFTGEERRHLERIAAFPGFREWGIVARSASLDITGARFVLPFPDSVRLWEMPIPKFAALKDVAYANAGRAALLLSQGRAREAEETLRESISVGLVMMDDGEFLIESLIGAVIAGIGRDQLQEFYRATGRNPEADALQAAIDSVRARVEELGVERQRLGGDRGTASPSSIRREVLRTLWDTTSLRSLRWELLPPVVLAPCTNARELVFGPSADVTAALDRAAVTLGRHPGERERFRYERASFEHFSLPNATGIPNLLYHAAQGAGALMENRRFPACVAALLAITPAP